jgi:hypothetical protein
MWLLLLPLKLRYILVSTALAGVAASGVSIWRLPEQAAVLPVPLVVFGFFAVLGLRDFFQPRHAILRNYPITAHLRLLFEKIRPEMRQYAGLDHPSQLRPHHFMRRVTADCVVIFAEVYRFLKPGELQSGCGDPRYAGPGRWPRPTASRPRRSLRLRFPRLPSNTWDETARQAGFMAFAMRPCRSSI